MSTPDYNARRWGAAFSIIFGLVLLFWLVEGREVAGGFCFGAAAMLGLQGGFRLR